MHHVPLLLNICIFVLFKKLISICHFTVLTRFRYCSTSVFLFSLKIQVKVTMVTDLS